MFDHLNEMVKPPRAVRNNVIAMLADGHWWTVGELADTTDDPQKEVERVVFDLHERGFVTKADNEEPVMYGWTVEPKAVERLREAQLVALTQAVEMASTHLHNLAAGLEDLRDKQRRSKVLESDKPLPDNLIPSAAIYGKAIRMTQRDLAAALAALSTSPDKEERKLKSNCPFCGAREGGWHKESCRLTSDNSDQPNREET